MTTFDKDRRDGVLAFAGQDRDFSGPAMRVFGGHSDRQGRFGSNERDALPGISHLGETLTGTDSDDQLTGGRGHDTLEGGDGNDVLRGKARRDVINGGAGDDYIADGWGTGTMDGGAGIDTVDVSHTRTGSVIDLVAGTIDWDGHSPTEVALNFENAVGSQGDNTIIGTDGDNILDGQAGDDRLNGGKGNDTLYGGAGRSTYVYNLGDGSDVIYNGSGSASSDVDGYSDDLDWNGRREKDDGARSGKDHRQDSIEFGAGITADDVEIMHVGADLILTLADGETLTLKDFDAYPIETLEFADGSTQDISSYQPQNWTGRRKTWFTSGRDNHTGGEGDDTLNGRSGHDQLHGGGGDDTLLGGSGRDGLYGGEGDDKIDGGSGEDIFEFSKGDGIDIIDDFDPATDTLRINGAGNNSIIIEYLTIGTLITYGRDDDGNPVDQIFLVGVASGLVTNDDIEKPDVEFVGTNDADVFEGTDAAEEISTHGGDDIINAEGGSDFIQAGDGNDEIHAGAGDDRFYGSGGDDVFFGDEGDDELHGGAGSDTFTGGAGADLIELNFGDGIDTMTDFEDGVDIIDLSETGLAFGNLTITDAADGVHITYETDAGGVAIGELILTGVTAETLSEEDFHFG